MPNFITGKHSGKANRKVSNNNRFSNRPYNAVKSTQNNLRVSRARVCIHYVYICVLSRRYFTPFYCRLSASEALRTFSNNYEISEPAAMRYLSRFPHPKRTSVGFFYLTTSSTVTFVTGNPPTFSGGWVYVAYVGRNFASTLGDNRYERGLGLVARRTNAYVLPPSTTTPSVNRRSVGTIRIAARTNNTRYYYYYY